MGGRDRREGGREREEGIGGREREEGRDEGGQEGLRGRKGGWERERGRR